MLRGTEIKILPTSAPKWSQYVILGPMLHRYSNFLPNRAYHIANGPHLILIFKFRRFCDYMPLLLPKHTSATDEMVQIIWATNTHTISLVRPTTMDKIARDIQ